MKTARFFHASLLCFGFVLSLMLCPVRAERNAIPADREVVLFDFKIEGEKQMRHFAIELADKEAPVTSANFRDLVQRRFYKGLAFHRAYPGTLLQVGDPLSRHSDRSRVGTTGPGYTLQPEIRLPHSAGAVAMARLPDKTNPSRRSNGSQFFICLKAMPNLNGQYTVFGKVVAGEDDLQFASKRPVDTNDNPLGRIEIRKVQLVPFSAVSAVIPAKTQ